MAPEMIQKSQYDESVDIWGLGVLIYELMTGKTPFIESEFSFNQTALEQNIVSMNLAYPKDFPILAQDLVNKMLNKDPKSRIKIQQIRAHPWVNLKENKPNRPLSMGPSKKIGKLLFIFISLLYEII